MSIRGWVYIIDNAGMPSILKIGYSTKDPSLRAKELGGTGSPHPYRVVFDVLVENPRGVEQAAHVMLASKHEGKEWFRCSHTEAIAAIRNCAKSVLVERHIAKEEQQRKAEEGKMENISPLSKGKKEIPSPKSRSFSSTSAYKGNCVNCGVYFTVTLTTYDSGAKCPECYCRNQ